MPWESMTVTDERIRFVLAYLREVVTEQKSMRGLCEEFRISRKTGYQVVDRQRRLGWAGLGDRSRAPLSGPHWMAPDVREAILGLKKKHSEFGAKKILAWLELVEPEREWPSVSAIHQTLKRAGLVQKASVRRRYPHPGPPSPYMAGAPNVEWSTDFKGQFRTRDRRYCYPLTIADTFSRYLLSCESTLHPTFEQTWRVFERVFREYGLPESIRSDNGNPFASPALRRLSKLSVRWIRLGIRPQLIQPGKPQQNGRHERMHRTLKQYVGSHPARNARDQQKAFDVFRQHFNDERPHEALNQTPPAQSYTRSPRIYPARLPDIEYPAGVESRKVNANGVIKWHRRELFLSEVLAGEQVGLQLIEDGFWLLMFGTVVLGYYSEHDRKLSLEKPA